MKMSKFSPIYMESELIYQFHYLVHNCEFVVKNRLFPLLLQQTQ